MSDLSSGRKLYEAVDGLVLGVMDEFGVPRERQRQVGKVSLLDVGDEVDGVRRYRMLDVLPQCEDSPPAFWIDFQEGEDDLAPSDSHLKVTIADGGGLLVRKRMITRQETPNGQVLTYLLDHVLPTISGADKVSLELERDNDRNS